MVKTCLNFSGIYTLLCIRLTEELKFLLLSIPPFHIYTAQGSYRRTFIRNQLFNIALFQVVPLSSHLGIIQWVDGTKDLKGLMLGVLNKNEKDL
jgi:hypothetical protein